MIFLIFQTKISKCDKCSSFLEGNEIVKDETPRTSENVVDPLLSRAQERVRELELELVQKKLAYVEAECRNQVF